MRVDIPSVGNRYVRSKNARKPNSGVQYSGADRNHYRGSSMYRNQRIPALKSGYPIATSGALSSLCLALTTVVIMLASGCCGPMGCGPGCDVGGCYDCDGCRSGPFIANTPIDALRQMKRQMICGSGCGETYVGEWTSTPPDCYDPCCGDQFVGGAVKAQPFCWAPGTIRNGFRGIFGSLYGVRFCDGCGAGVDDCACGGYIDNGYVDDGYIDGGVIGNGAGCSTCQAQSQGNVRMAQQIRQPRGSAYRAAALRQAERVRAPAGNHALAETPSINAPQRSTARSASARSAPTRTSSGRSAIRR